jgi:DNA-binding Lrp family transcriptional regulator
MPAAYILISVESGTDTIVLQALKKISNVKEAEQVYGVYDIIARIEADTMDELKNMVFDRIRQLDKVKSTTTMIIM